MLQPRLRAAKLTFLMLWVNPDWGDLLWCLQSSLWMNAPGRPFEFLNVDATYFGAIPRLWGAAPRTGGCAEAALVSTHDVPGAAQPLLPGCDLH